jgi:prefoldin subunit 5
MSITSASKKVLNPELDRLRAEKQRISGLIDVLNTQKDSLLAQKNEVQSAIDSIKADIEAV